jgi:uncharacterized integral membrane protein
MLWTGIFGILFTIMTNVAKLQVYVGHTAKSAVRAYNDMIYLLTAIGLSPGGSSTVHIYTQTVHRTTQLTN